MITRVLESASRRNWILLAVAILALLAVLVWQAFQEKYREKKLTRLTNCGPELSVPEQDSQRSQLIIIGDSRAEGWRQPELGNHWQAVNMAVSAETSYQTLCRIDWMLNTLASDVFVLQTGINDLVAASLLDIKARQETEIQTRHNISTIIEKLLKAEKKVLVLTVPPPINMDLPRKLVWGADIASSSESLSAFIRQQDHPSLITVDLEKEFWDSQSGEWREDLSTDALHWNNKAYHLLTRKIKALIL